VDKKGRQGEKGVENVQKKKEKNSRKFGAWFGEEA